MNRVVEYIIRAKDATGAVLKSAMQKVEQFRQTSGTSIEGIANATKKALPSFMAVSSAFGMMEGAAGQAGRAITAIASSAMAFGPLGAALTAIQVIIGIIASKAQEACQKMQEAAARMTAHVQKRMAEVKQAIVDEVQSGIDKATASVEKLEHAFERLAKKRAGLQKSVAGDYAAGQDAKMLGMQRQMSEAVFNAKDEDKGKVRAEWELKLAKEREKTVAQTAEYEAAMQAQAIKDDEHRVKLAQDAARKYDAQAAHAQAERDRVAELVGKNDPTVKQLEKQVEQAKRQADRERERAKDIQADIDVAKANLMVDDKKRQNQASEASNRVLEAQQALKQAEIDYQKNVEEQNRKRLELEKEAERDRLAAEAKLHQERLKNAEKEVAASEKLQSEAQGRLAAAQAKVSQAWGWYKDKSSMQREIDAYKQQKEAEAQWVKDFDKLKSKRRDWRDVEFGELSADEEAVRQVALAKDAEKQANMDLARVANNTDALADILSLLKGGEE